MQRSPSGQPHYWMAFPSSDPSHILPYSTPLQLLVWDDSPWDNSLVPNAGTGAYLWYIPPTTNLEVSITSSSAGWSPVAFSPPFNSFFSSFVQGYEWEDESGNFPPDAQYTFTWNGQYTGCAAYVTLLMGAPYWMSPNFYAQAHFLQVAPSLTNVSANIAWFCGAGNRSSSTTGGMLWGARPSAYSPPIRYNFPCPRM